MLLAGFGLRVINGPALMTGSLLGGYLGAHLAITHGNRWIKRVFEVLTLLVGITLILGAL